MENKYDIKFEVIDFPNFIPHILYYSYRSSVFNPVDTLSLSIIRTSKEQDDAFAPNDTDSVLCTHGPRRVRFYIDSKLQFEGYITKQTVSSDNIIEIECQNYMFVLDKASLPKSCKVKKSETVISAIERNLKALGFGTVKTGWLDVVSERTGNAIYNDNLYNIIVDYNSYLVGTEYKVNDNENALSYVNRLLSRYGLVVHVDKYPDISVFVPGDVDNTDNNFDIIIQEDYSNVINYNMSLSFDIPTFLKVTGKNRGNDNATSNLSYTPTNMLRSWFKTFYRTNIFVDFLYEWDPIHIDLRSKKELTPENYSKPNGLYIPYLLTDNDSKTQEELAYKAQLEMGKHLKDLMYHTYTFPGHDINGKYFCPNTYVSINDEVNMFNDVMYITEIEYQNSTSSGPTTTITCIYTSILPFLA